MTFPPRPALQYVAIGVYVVLLAGVFLFPSVPLPSWPGGTVAWNMYATVHGVCAQMHNTMIGGMQLPLCARNTGIYGAMTISLLAMWALGRIRTRTFPPVWMTILLLIPVLIMAIDGLNSLFVDLEMQSLYTPRNQLRTLTGAMAGIAIAPFFVPLFNRVLRINPKETPVMANAVDLIVLWGLAFCFSMLVIIGPSWSYWPISIISWLGIVGILLISNGFAVAVAFGYDQRVAHVRELAAPVLVATAITIAELGLMSWLRFGFEMNGLFPS
jgi:uncharacterized membrane protein